MNVDVATAASRPARLPEPNAAAKRTRGSVIVGAAAGTRGSGESDVMLMRLAYLLALAIGLIIVRKLIRVLNLAGIV